MQENRALLAALVTHVLDKALVLARSFESNYSSAFLVLEHGLHSRQVPEGKFADTRFVVFCWAIKVNYAAMHLKEA